MITKCVWNYNYSNVNYLCNGDSANDCCKGDTDRLKKKINCTTLETKIKW